MTTWYVIDTRSNEIINAIECEGPSPRSIRSGGSTLSISAWTPTHQWRSCSVTATGTRGHDMRLARHLAAGLAALVAAYWALLRLAVALDYWESKHRPLRLSDKPRGVKFYEWDAQRTAPRSAP